MPLDRIYRCDFYFSEDGKQIPTMPYSYSKLLACKFRAKTLNISSQEISIFIVSHESLPFETLNGGFCLFLEYRHECCCNCLKSMQSEGNSRAHSSKNCLTSRIMIPQPWGSLTFSILSWSVFERKLLFQSFWSLVFVSMKNLQWTLKPPWTE